MTAASSSTRPSGRRVRRGSAYIAVLGISLLVTTMGLGAMLAIRSQRRTGALQADESEARAYALGALDIGARVLASDAAWRGKFASGVYTAASPFGRGTLAYKLVDELDGDLGDDAIDPVRLYGAGRIGGAARIYSIGLTPTGPALAAISLPVYSAGAITTSGAVYASGGPLACAGLLTVALGSTVNADVECGSLLKTGTVTGTTTAGVAARPMPSAGLFDTYRAMGTAITFGSVPSGTIQQKVVGPGSNPYGAVNAAGVYVIDVPTLSTLTISQSRLAATLVIDLGASASLVITGANAWEPPAEGMPVILVRGGTLASVTISGSLTPLAEAAGGTNYNPASTPYFGNADSDIIDTYPSEIRGVIHISSASVGATLTGDAVLRGSFISAGAVTLSGSATVRGDPRLAQTPPAGYITPTGMARQALSWRRETDP